MNSPLRKARKAKGWTQEDLASKTGLTQSTISRVECGSPVSPETAAALAAAVGISELHILYPERFTEAA